MQDRPHPDSSGSRFGATVEVRTGLVAPAIQTWGFIKAEGTLRVFYLNIININK